MKWRKGLIVAALHVAIIASLGAKLLLDRATRPRVWARAAPVDPNLPIRGRYVQLRVEAEPLGDLRSGGLQIAPVALFVRDGELAASPDPEATNGTRAQLTIRGGAPAAIVLEPLAYFIPEHAIDPSIRRPGEELWVEVTVPRAGAPRPIRLGIRKGGVLTPLELK
jgi:GDYXXLXY protein